MTNENDNQTPLIIMLETQADIERDIKRVLDGLYKNGKRNNDKRKRRQNHKQS